MWTPQPGPQSRAIEADRYPELLYGGAAGGGKSDFLLGDWLQDVPTYGADWQGVLFRRTLPELEQLLKRSRGLFAPQGARYHENNRAWTWPNGAVLKLRSLPREAEASRYQGHEYTWIGWDELTQWPSLAPYHMLRARLRSARPVPTKRIRATANPGGVGHLEVKRYFVDPAPGGYAPIVDPDTGVTRLFIPARLQDNQALMTADPGYADRLRGVGSETLVRAWLEGDWSIVEGAFFDDWSGRNVVRPFAVPPDWPRLRSFDWGSAAPFSVGWWAVVSEPWPAESAAGPLTLPRGTLVRYREWYGAKRPGVGLKLTAEEVAAGILAREGGERMAKSVADPSIFAANGGPSIGERMARMKVTFQPADNRRVGEAGASGGWDQMRARIRGDAAGPGLVVFDTCADFIRTVPVLQHDPMRPEDVDSRSEDHAADECRYACMSRPMARPPAEPEPPPAKDYRLFPGLRAAGYIA